MTAVLALASAPFALAPARADESADRIRGFYDSCLADAKAGVERNPLIRLPPEMNLMCACAAGALIVTSDRGGDVAALEKDAEQTKGCFRSFAGVR